VDLQDLVASKCRSIDRMRLSLTCRDANRRWYDTDLATALRFFRKRIILKGPLTLSAPVRDKEYLLHSVKLHLQPASLSTLHLNVLQEFWQDASMAERVVGGLQKDGSWEVTLLERDKGNMRVRSEAGVDYLEWFPLLISNSYSFAVLELESAKAQGGVLRLAPVLQFIVPDGKCQRTALARVWSVFMGDI
jgi:hypothetical protein